MRQQGQVKERLLSLTAHRAAAGGKLIQELDQEEKNMVFKMIETFLTKKKFKDFFNKNIAAL